ncbi:MAG: SgcJ/EcaC family oxidoreductase [Scytonematopsis contorta HA4267-MV1]|jgi:uncharacterized protein (TIGR02246 family)|nr:SgcJ/EcaC family oxidoreductase [Scytonematopsis contorta HA4267-MV1]
MNRFFQFSASSTLSLALLIFTIQTTGILRADNKNICPRVSKSEIAKLFDRWNASLKTLEPNEVVKNYASDAVLLPTVSNKVRHNSKEMKDYFEHFLQKKPVGKIDERNIRIYCDMAIDSGRYTFSVVDRNGKPGQVKARYTFVYRKIVDQWLIEEHHSSIMPEK